MERRVEAGDLRHSRIQPAGELNAGNGLRQMLRHKGHESLKRGNHFGGDSSRLAIIPAPMHDAMADRLWRLVGQQLREYGD